MNNFLIRISLGLQLFSLPLLTPQVVGEDMMDALRTRMRDLAKPALRVAGVVFTAGLFFLLVAAAPLFYASANRTTIATYNSWPHWAQLMTKISFLIGGLATGGAFGIALILALLAGLLQLATARPQGFFVLGGIMFVAAVALQFWATFYPVQ
jgi:hypothetical protein